MPRNHSLELDLTARAETNWLILTERLVEEDKWACLLEDFGPETEDIAKSLSIPRWDPCRFLFQGTLPYSEDRRSRPIELYTDGLSGRTLAAKRWPLKEVRGNMAADKLNDGQCSLEAALSEVMLTLALSGSEPCGPGAGVYACHGAFLDERGDVILLTEHLPGGGLLRLARGLGPAGPERERRAWPAALALLRAVRWLHARGVAHLNVTLESALLRPGPRDEAVVLIDLGIAEAGGRRLTESCLRTGPYQAPETWGDQPWDTFAADFWACGVATFSLAVGNYPWESTKPGACPKFSYFAEHGFQAFIQSQLVVGKSGAPRPLTECLSPRMSKFLNVLLSFKPSVRESATVFLA